MRRFVAIGSTKGHDYSAFLPIVGLFWRHRIEYEPMFFLVGDHAEWDASPARVAVRALDSLGMGITWVSHIEGVEDATISQCVRQHAAASSDFNPEDLLICSDADLVPLREEFYYTHDVQKYDIGLYYSNGYRDEVNHFPSCHYSMRVSTWREVMRLDVGLDAAMRRNFKDYGLAAKMDAKKADPAKNWGHVWFTDELVASKRIVESGKTLQKIERDGWPPNDRLDRAYWPERYDIASYTDCHSIRPIWSDPNWPRFRPIIEQGLPSWLEWADRYRHDFRQAMGVGR